MKKIKSYLVVLILIFNGSIYAQIVPVSDSIAINQFKASLYSDGRLVSVRIKNGTAYDQVLHTEAPWIAGIDNGNTLRFSAEMYGTGPANFVPGPISNDPNATTKYNKVYKVSLQTISTFVRNGGSLIPPEIANWPAHGDVAMGEAPNLAPFVDVNGDGQYRPADGDYPDIKGDEALFVMFNDMDNRTSGTPLGVEIHAMLYGYNTGGREDSILFKEYKIFNRSSSTYASSYFSVFADFASDFATNYLVGTGVSSHSIFRYDYSGTCGIRIFEGPNADYFDGIDNDMDGCIDGILVNGICVPENPATGINEKIIMSNNMIFEKSGGGAKGTPQSPLERYQSIQSKWRNGNNLIIETPSGLGNTANGDGYDATNSGTAVNYFFPGQSFDTTGAYIPNAPQNWFHPPGQNFDLNTLASEGPFTLDAGEEFSVVLAITGSVGNPNDRGYNNITGKLRDLNLVYSNPPNRNVSLYDFPVADDYSILFDAYKSEWYIKNHEDHSLKFKLYSVSGQFIKEIITKSENTAIPLSEEAKGVYIIVDNRGNSNKIIR